jgi:hypothetical protein
LWRMAIILKANKVNLFVSSVLFVFWYQSPNFLDTPRISLFRVQYIARFEVRHVAMFLCLKLCHFSGPSLGMNGAIIHSTKTSSWCGQGQIYFYNFIHSVTVFSQLTKFPINHPTIWFPIQLHPVNIMACIHITKIVC